MNNKLNENLKADEELDSSPEQQDLLASIEHLLAEQSLNQKLRDMDMQVARVMTLEEFQAFTSYKCFCLGQLEKYCSDAAQTVALNAAIQQGFMLGYWAAMQHAK